MLLSDQFYQTEKTGYLNEEFRLFHINLKIKNTIPCYIIIFTISKDSRDCSEYNITEME